MKKFNFIAIAIILIMLIAFISYNYYSKNTFHVTKVYSPMQVAININKNGKSIDSEKFEISNVETFTSKASDFQKVTAEKLGLDEDTALAIGYYAEKYAQSLLEDKEVTIKIIDTDNSKIEINVNGKNYNHIIQASPFALKNGKPINQKEFNKQVELAKKIQLRIYNNKSNKYHKLSCKYGQMAHDSLILPKNQIPKSAQACKVCENTIKKVSKKNIKNPNTKEREIIKHILPHKFKLSSGNIKLFLTDLTTNFTPSNKCTSDYCREIVTQINNSNSNIDIALYGYTDITDITNALKNAIRRGVSIRFVYDITKNGTNFYPDTLALSRLIGESKADFGTSSYQNAIMHNKFFIFDNTIVLTGSANISTTDISGFNSNAIVLIKSKEIAQIYKKEFEQLYNGKFHNKKIMNESSNVIIDDSIVSVYFTPQTLAITDKVIPLINNAQSYIDIPAFVITHKKLAQALINAHKRGIKIRIILDATNANNDYSVHKLLRENGIEVKTENFAGKMHSKSMIIDDRYLILGSMNFSKSGETKNDENVLIIENSELTKYYRSFFNYVWNKIPNKWLTQNAASESHDSLGSCFDGIDNDFDGKIDSEDSGCKPLSTKY